MCTDYAQTEDLEIFVVDKEMLNKGLILFRRGDVQHREFYCRIRVQHERRYKTVALRTEDITTARTKAYDAQAEVRYAVKHDVPIFNRSFKEVAEEYLKNMERREGLGEVSLHRYKNLQSRLNGVLNEYVGSKQVHNIAQEAWQDIPRGGGRTARAASARESATRRSVRR